MDGLTTLELIGVMVGIAVGVASILSLVLMGGVRMGRFANREDLTRTSDRLEEKIEDTKTDLEKKIEDTKTDLEKKIEDTKTDLEKKIEDTKTDLEKKIDDSNERIDRRFDDVMLAIQNLSTRLETAVMEHTHDEDGVAVFRRHPQMVDADD